MNLMGQIFERSVSVCKFDRFMFGLLDYAYVLCRHKFLCLHIWFIKYLCSINTEVFIT